MISWNNSCYPIGAVREHSRRIASILAVILAFLLPGCAAYRKCGFEGCPGDQQISAEVRARLDQYAVLQPPNLIRVQTLDRVVYLTGQVNTGLTRQLAESVARSAPQVRNVVDSIAITYDGK